MNERLQELAREALARLDRLLAAKDARSEFQDMSDVTRTVVLMRDHLIAQLRAGEAGAALQEKLDRINAILSITASAEMPLQGVHWDRIQKCRDLLAEMSGTIA